MLAIAVEAFLWYLLYNLSDNFKINIAAIAMLFAFIIFFHLIWDFPWNDNWFSIEILIFWVICLQDFRSCLNLYQLTLLGSPPPEEGGEMSSYYYKVGVGVSPGSALGLHWYKRWGSSLLLQAPHQAFTDTFLADKECLTSIPHAASTDTMR